MVDHTRDGSGLGGQAVAFLRSEISRLEKISPHKMNQPDHEKGRRQHEKKTYSRALEYFCFDFS